MTTLEVEGSPKTLKEIPPFVSGPTFQGVVDKEWKVVEESLVVKQEDFPKVFQTALKIENEEKNRYNDVLANEKTRVQLKHSFMQDEHKDYINANRMTSMSEMNDKVSYIAAQAPTSETLADWFRMIWYENIEIILMLGKETEGGSVKCTRYWPKPNGRGLSEGGFTMLPVKESVESGVIRRELTISHNNVSRNLIQIQYTLWPDRGVPDKMDEFLTMVDYVDKTIDSLWKGKKIPLLLHCSAGLGRTGVFIIVHSQKHKKTQEFGMLKLLEKIRGDRAGMVQTKPQYEFAWKALAKVVEKIH